MNIKNIACILLLSAHAIGLAKQINIGSVRHVTVPVKSESNKQNNQDEQILDEPIDFETEGDLSPEDLKKPLWVVMVNKIVSPFFVLYNWLHKN